MRRILPLRALVVCSGLLAIAVVAWSAPARSQAAEGTSNPTRSAAFQRALDAWNQRAYDLVPALFQDALDAGGLKKADVVDAYARIGAASAILHGSHAALPALRKAALLDPDFKLPPDAGKKALALAEQARREQAHFGSLGITAETAGEVESAAAIPVEVSLTLRSPLVDTVSVEARDPLTAHVWSQSRAPAEGLHFEVPARMTLPDASIVIVIEARDAHRNQLASVEKRVHVAAPPAASAVATPPPAPPPLVVVATERRSQIHDESPPVHPNREASGARRGRTSSE